MVQGAWLLPQNAFLKLGNRYAGKKLGGLVSFFFFQVLMYRRLICDISLGRMIEGGAVGCLGRVAYFWRFGQEKFVLLLLVGLTFFSFRAINQ